MSEENAEKFALLPRLRFPEFSDAWRADRVGNIAKIFKGKGIAKSDISNDGIHSCIRYGELYTVYGELVTKVLSRTSLPAAELFFGEQNDVIIPSSGETKEDIATAACVIPGGIAFGGDLNVLRTKEEGAFLSYYLNGPLRRNIACVAQGDSVVHLYPYQIEKLPIAVPVRNEQKKIADCLSSVDDLITAETQKLDALKIHKKGLMQQLFPREGETVPRLRFPEFLDAVEWEDRSLESVCNGIASGKDKNDPDGLYDLYGSTGIIGKTSTASYRGKFLLVARVGANAGLLTKSDGEFGATDNTLVIRLNDSVNFNFVFYYLDDLNLNKLIFGSGQPLITGGQLKALSLYFPSETEQQKIADCLSFLDELIAAQSQKNEALKTHKKGLMQQLFPVQDVVSA